MNEHVLLYEVLTESFQEIIYRDIKCRPVYLGHRKNTNIII